jgi:hypothetical protein
MRLAKIQWSKTVHTRRPGFLIGDDNGADSVAGGDTFEQPTPADQDDSGDVSMVNDDTREGLSLAGHDEPSDNHSWELSTADLMNGGKW